MKNLSSPQTIEAVNKVDNFIENLILEQVKEICNDENGFNFDKLNQYCFNNFSSYYYDKECTQFCTEVVRKAILEFYLQSPVNDSPDKFEAGVDYVIVNNVTSEHSIKNGTIFKAKKLKFLLNLVLLMII